MGGQRVHVLAVARRLDRLLPSQWQQRVKSGATTLSYERWLEVVLGDHPDDPVWRNIWVPHDRERLAARWSAASAPDRFVLVVPDETDRRLVSAVVEQMLGLDGGTLRPDEVRKDNASLSYDRLELLRALGRLDDGMSSTEWATLCRGAVRLADEVPAERRVPPLPEWALERVREKSRERAEVVRSLDVRVVGDPDHLLVPDDVRPAAPSPADVVPTELAARVLQLVTSLGDVSR